MAYTPKSAAQKAKEAKALKVKEVVQEEVQNTEEVVTQVEKVTEAEVVPVKNRKTRKDINLNEMIPCRNITSGSLIYVSKKTGFEANWTNFNDEESIDVAELLTMNSSQPRFLKEPWIMIDDDDMVDYLGLREMYDNIILADELETFFRLSPAEVSAKLRIAPKGTRTLIGEKARVMIDNETLYDTRVIKAIETELQLDLSIFTK